MASVNLGKVGLLLRGDWDSDTDYAALDVVSHEGYSYAARVANKNVEPSAETAAYWQPLAESASVLATMLGYKNDAADSATAAAGSATAAATSASSATDALANEAADFSSSNAYAIGDYVIYNNGTHKYLYRFTAAHSAGAWVGTDAVQVALADDVSDLKSAITNIQSNFDYSAFDIDSDIFTEKLSYNASSAGWVYRASGDMNSYYFMTTFSIELYAPDTISNRYYSIALYNGEVSSANYITRYRSNDNNLPTKTNPVTVGAGCTVVVTIDYRDTNFILYASNAPLLLGEVFMEQVDDNSKANAGTAVENFKKDNFNYGSISKNSSILTSKTGYRCSSAGWTEDIHFNSWYFTATEDVKIYPATTALNYYSICVFNGSVASANYVTRYRQSDSNMPTKSFPASITKNQVVVITIQDTDADFVLYSSSMPVLLGDQMVTEVNSLINNAVNKTIITASTGKYLIASNGILFDFRHSVNVETNQDCWHFVNVSKNGVNIVNGDIIGVFRESGQLDFMGGVHGDEEIVDFFIKADGADITEETTVCDVVTIYMHSHLYRVSSPTTNVLDRYVNMTITNGVLTVENSVKCLVDNFVIDYAYNGGLIGIFKQNVSLLSSNTDVADLDNMPTATDWNDSSDNYWYDVELSNGMIHVENIKGNEQPNYSARVHYFSNENPERLKIYITTDHGTTWNTGHVCNGKFSYTFA